jgi:hypothetical protein
MFAYYPNELFEYLSLYIKTDKNQFNNCDVLCRYFSIKTLSVEKVIYIYIYIYMDNIEVCLMKERHWVCAGLKGLLLSASDRCFEYGD